MAGLAIFEMTSLASISAPALIFTHTILRAVPTSTSRHGFWALGPPTFLSLSNLLCHWTSSTATTRHFLIVVPTSRSISHESHLSVSQAGPLPISVLSMNPSTCAIAFSSHILSKSSPSRLELIATCRRSAPVAFFLVLFAISGTPA